MAETAFVMVVMIAIEFEIALKRPWASLWLTGGVVSLFVLA